MDTLVSVVGETPCCPRCGSEAPNVFRGNQGEVYVGCECGCTYRIEWEMFAGVEEIDDGPQDCDRDVWAKRPKIVAVDVDGTLAEFNGWKGHDQIGPLKPGAREFLETMHEKGWGIILSSCRLNCFLEKWAHDQGIDHLIDGYNSNPWSVAAGGDWSTKPAADVYVDDRAIAFGGDWSVMAGLVERMAAEKGAA